MTTAVFVDSTTLLYPLDTRSPPKKARCAAWLKILRERDLLILSPQVLNETYWVVLRKPDFAAARPIIRDYVRSYARWANAPLTADTLIAAFGIEDSYRLRFWDSLLVASANAAGCSFFLSEDMNDAQTYGSVRMVDPFRHTPEDVLGAAARP
jgi:predicted nucleic acid-binding protein